ncbi:MAG: LOG family protein [Bacilli bacterium]
MKKIFIALSSSECVNSKYYALSTNVAKVCINKNYEIYMGARKTGMMKRLYQSCIENNGAIKDILSRELDDSNYKETTTIICDSIFDQLSYFMKCDVTLVLPGGFGTQNELFTSIMGVFTNNVNGKIVLFNYDHFYDKFLEFIDFLSKEKFIDNKVFSVITSVNELEEIL